MRRYSDHIGFPIRMPKEQWGNDESTDEETKAEESDLALLRQYRCDMVQGYLFSPPVPVDEFEDMVRRGRRLPT